MTNQIICKRNNKNINIHLHKTDSTVSTSPPPPPLLKNPARTPLPAALIRNSLLVAACFFCQATAAHNKESVFPVPVGDSNKPFCF